MLTFLYIENFFTPYKKLLEAISERIASRSTILLSDALKVNNSPSFFVTYPRNYFCLQLLSAIQSIDEVLNPSSNELDVSKGSERSHSRIPRKWTSTAPWRKEPKGRQGPSKTTKAEGIC